MSTRKSTVTSPTAAQGTKLENASTSPLTKSSVENKSNNDGSSAADTPEMGAANTSNNASIKIHNTDEPKATEQTQKTTTQQDTTKSFQQRVTRNSPLLLASPNAGLSIKKEPLDSNDHHTNSESEEVEETVIAPKKGRGRKPKDHNKETAEKEKEGKLDELENKEKIKEKEESKEKEASASSASASNRLTRKSVANQEAANTRVTRQRQSSGASTRSETPPARGRGRGLGRSKMPVPMADPSATAAAKRKRSVDVDNAGSIKSSLDEPGPKYLKIEIKDPEIENEDILLSSQNTNASSECSETALVKIKQELIDESENEMAAATENANATATANSSLLSTAGTTNVGRGRGRNPNRKSTANSTTSATNTHSSPTTRATRQTKHNSPVQATATAEAKKRRMGSQTRGVLKANAGSNANKSHAINAEDEDSKDSMASNNTDDIVLALIKSEKISMEMDDDNTIDAKDLLVAAEKGSIEILSNLEETSDLPPPLVVDTDVPPSININIEHADTVESSALTPAAASCSSVASGSEKAASLSPSELVSEGVSEISVKQFYKKPKFLENNLGIEEDPKLGNIVQKVAVLETATTSSTAAATAVAPALAYTSSSAGPGAATETNVAMLPDVTAPLVLDDSGSNESLKEGTLQFDESLDDKKSTAQDDGNSLSSDDNPTPLLIVEDDEVEEEQDEEVEMLENLNENEDNKETSQVEKNSSARNDAAKEIVFKASSELPVIKIVEEDQGGKVDDQDDDLTLEESETISMDNNASINDELVTEIEDPVNDIEDITELNEVIEKDATCDNIKDDLNKKVELFANGKEAADLLVNANKDGLKQPVSITAAVTAAAAEVEDNDVLAKIDAELKKIDERSKEKLTISNSNVDNSNINSADIIALEKTSIKPMDIDGEINVNEHQQEVKDVTKDMGAIIDDVVLDIKLDDEQQVLITSEDIKLTDVKFKSDDDEEDVGFISDMDNMLKNEKLEINKKKLLKPSTSDTELETLNGKPTQHTLSSVSSPIKMTGLTAVKDDDTTSMKSGQSAASWITLDLENDDEESLRKKELHLQNLGLVTHKAAEKRRQEVIQSSAANVEASKVVVTQQNQNKRNGKNSSHAAPTTHHEYTGTLKTIIKINRNTTGGSASGNNNGRKNQNNATASTTSKEQQQQQRRQSLKMTFQKGRARAHGSGNNDRSQQDREGHGEDSYYTIQNETEGAPQKIHNFPTTSTTSSLTRLALTHTNKYSNNNIVKNLTTTYARKSYNYRNNHQHNTHSNNSNKTAHIFEMDSSNSESHDHLTGVVNKKDEKEEILIPEKASSFKFHPGRLCEDQCFYCSGKFGLYDTPCHVGQIKSLERQQKILANEEKLTVDNCLCDACFRHVDRRANVPSYKKRLTASGHLESLASTSSKSLENVHYDGEQNVESDGHEGGGLSTNSTARKCLVPDCVHPASHSLRRKCIRKSVKKFLLKFEIPAGAACVWLCQSHYDTVIQCSGCVLCKRRLGKNHMYHITSDTDRLEKALCEMGIPVQLGIGTAVCKLCRYFANLLMKPPDSTKSQKAEFVKNYRKRLLQFHNIHDGSNDASDADEDDSNSATNNDNQELPEKSTLLEQQSDTLKKQKDDHAADTSVANLAGKNIINSDSNNSKSGEKATTKTADRDFDTTGISTDSSNSSTVSNAAATNSPAEMSKLKAILQSNAAAAEKQPAANDISNVLRANPNISMRELFPGEEDLGLQFKVPFGGSGSQRTPEGWTRVQTFLQYDEPTRRLWEELQKPYGNQSSFLRHLILLEKYFRNGDLILSASASSNASVYTQTVRQRLTSYDKGHCGGLHIGTGVPKENKSSSHTAGGSKAITAAKSKEIDPKIPTFVINEDDDEDEEDEDSDDQDVELTSVEKLPKPAGGAASTALQHNKQKLQRSRSLSVDKLTKQLSSNSVTITARPKDPSLAAANSKRATPSPQKSLLKDNIMQQTSTSSSSSAANLAAANAAAAVALAASTASAASAGGPSNSRSILKCNLLGINKSVEILPISSSANTTITKTSATHSNAPPPPPPPPASIPPSAPTAVAETKQQKILDVANKLLGNHLEAAAAAANLQNKNQASLLSSPPELVSLQRRSAGQVNAAATANTNNSHNNSNNNHSQQSTNLPKRPQLLVKPGTSRPPPNVVILPDSLTPQERLQSKTWRPTLMPVEENHNLLNKNGPLYQTADGRRLPALVQVQSGGKPFLISIFDYNRMCILRREKLMRDQMLKATKKRLESKQQQQQQHPQHQNHAQQQQHIQNQQHQQQQQQLQKANLQNMNKTYQTPSAAAVNQQRHQQQQQQQQQNAEQQRLLQYQILEHQQALIKAATAALNTPNNPQHAAAAAALRYHSILPKNPATSNMTNMPPALQTPLNTTNANFSTPMMPLLANAITNAANSGNVNPAASAATPSHNNSSWLWNNFPDANQLLLNGGGGAGGGGGVGAISANANLPKIPQLLAKSNNPASTLTNASNAAKLQQQQQQQMQQQQQFLLSKIPKSLTVIPQHKLMNNTSTGGSASASSGQTSVNLMKE